MWVTLRIFKIFNYLVSMQLYYRRSYKKIQTLIAEISSIISLLMEIGKQILSILNEKRMSIDIIRKLFMIDNNIIKI